MADYINLDRKFWPVEADKENDPESIRTMLAFGIGQQLSWDDILEKDRTVIIAEPAQGRLRNFRLLQGACGWPASSLFFAELSCFIN